MRYLCLKYHLIYGNDLENDDNYDYDDDDDKHDVSQWL